MPIDEILPGLRHWTAVHPDLGVEVSSYWLPREGVATDPIAPPEGLEAFDGAPPPAHLLLSTRLHLRDAEGFAQRFGATLHVHRSGVYAVQDADVAVEPYDWGDELPGGVTAVEVGAISPDETALHMPEHRALVVADGILRREADGPLAFMPDGLLGDDPEGVKAGLRAAFTRVADELSFEHLLLAHGGPVVGDGRERLRAFARDGHD